MTLPGHASRCRTICDEGNELMRVLLAKDWHCRAVRPAGTTGRNKCVKHIYML